MAKDKRAEQEVSWPTTTFHFLVKIDDQEGYFQEVSGLSTEYDVVDYRAGHTPEFSVVKMPGVKKIAEVTLKKGIFKDDKAVFTYFATAKMNEVLRKNITITLLDESNQALFVWTLQNAFPKKVVGVTMNAKSSDVAIEELLLGCEGISMTNGG